MQQDAWRTYLELALGLTEKPRRRAKQVIESLTARRGASVQQLRSMTEELVATSAANREALTRLVRAELDRTLGAVGLANAEELASLRRRVDELERRVVEQAGVPGRDAVAGEGAGENASVKKAPAAAAAKKAAAKKGTATGGAAAKKATAKKATAAKRGTAKKATAAKKTAAGKAAGTKAARTTTGDPAAGRAPDTGTSAGGEADR